MRRILRLPVLVLGLTVAAHARAAAQDVLIRAMDLEEAGAWQEAGTLYRQMLAAEPGNVAALLGLERVAVQAGGADTVLAYAERAMAADSLGPTGYAVALRTLRAVGKDSLAASVLERWIAANPGSPAPYREWARLSLKAGLLQDARDAVTLARERLKNATALAPEMAEIDEAGGLWGDAAMEWRAAAQAQPVYVEAAAFSMRPAPVAVRDGMLHVLTGSGPGGRVGRRIAADLLLGWNEPGRAWATLKSVLPEADTQRIAVLRGFAQRAGSLDGPGAQRAAAEAYELLATMSAPEDASTMRIRSARAYAAAGAGSDARRMLRAVADDSTGDAATRAAATSTMIELLVREGDPEEAERLLDAGGGAIPGTEREAVARMIAGGWIRLGRLDRAGRAVEADSSLAGDEVRGWVALYRGRLNEARRLLGNAGATTGDPADAPARAATVALLDAVGRDTLPDLGGALLLAARRDSLGASRALVRVARTLAGDGEAEPALLSWAARCAAAGGDSAGAVTLWREIADRFDSSTAAPAAELALARALASRGNARDAAARLEALILAHPGSALVPEARRELDRVRGLVPQP